MSARAASAAFAIVVCLIGAGCRSSGIRKLDQQELDYYAKLHEGLTKSAKAIEDAMVSTGVAEDDARYQAARFDQEIAAAAAVYSVREVLTAPPGERQTFVQNTRNTLIMYTLARKCLDDAAAIETQRVADGKRRAELVAATSRLAELTSKVIATEKLLHAYLNQPPSASLLDSLREVAKQIGAFHDESQKADQTNAFVAQATDASGRAADVSAKAATDLSKFLDAWERLNRKGGN